MEEAVFQTLQLPRVDLKTNTAAIVSDGWRRVFDVIKAASAAFKYKYSTLQACHFRRKLTGGRPQ
ncbi:hypothetical protein GCM10020370_71700 [Paenibacillus hodogayensis]